jgi:signal transduction histidine kinase
VQSEALIAALSRIPLFEGLTDDELRWVVEQGSEKLVRAGEINGREGEPVEHLYVILEGELRITKEVDGGEVVINVFTPGTFFAEVPLLSGTPFLATGRALTNCRFFLLPEEAFRHMLTVSPAFSHTILETMAQRVQILQQVAGQRERLNSLSNLAAGLAHELNNPAAASRRAISNLRGNIEATKKLAMKLRCALTPEELEILAALEKEASTRAASPPFLEPLARDDLEGKIAGWLRARGLEDGWDLAPVFADAALGTGWLGEVEATVPGDALPSVLEYLGATVTTADLLAEAEASVERISGLVEAVKSYSNMDQAPLGEVDINEGIEQTLTVLGYKLESGIEITRVYDPKLPRITANRGELNQVWTNLIDNAIDAVSGEAGENAPRRIGLRTTCEGDGVLVEVSDSGPGIPKELQARVFEPFYTTKGVGAGTGLGLDIAYRIVVGRHGGDIRVVSRPGDTRFQVRLPLQPGGGIEDPERSPEAEEEAPVR